MEIRFAASLEEVERVQAFEKSIWDDAISPVDGKPIKGAYEFYGKLWKLDRESILCAFDGNELVSYVGVERIRPHDIVRNPLVTGNHMPPWNHDPEGFFKPHGNVWYILNHSSKSKGASEQILDKLIRLAIEKGFHSIAVIFNLRHPYLRDPAEFWGRMKFSPISDTYDPKWHYRYQISDIPKGEFASGAIIWVRMISNEERQVVRDSASSEPAYTRSGSSSGVIRPISDMDPPISLSGVHFDYRTPPSQERWLGTRCSRNNAQKRPHF